MKILNVVGARPNFMKMAPIIDALNKYPRLFEHRLIHTGQHYDKQMSHVFFDDLGLPRPDVDLEVGSDSHARQTAHIMIAFERVCSLERPDLVIVVGDVNSTMACTITAKKLGIEVAHVEAGLRSRDMSMPEEINRLCTDVLCDFLFTTDHFANENLKREGVSDDKIHFVGNVMIDTLLRHRSKAAALPLRQELGLEKKKYAILTLHRPSNVDNKAALTGILQALKEIPSEFPIIFPAHPRTRRMIETFEITKDFDNGRKPQGLWLTDPLGYLDFLNLNMDASMVLTDSGGLQEETTVLGVPCITLRNNTERPITCTEGTNQVVGNNPDRIRHAIHNVLAGNFPRGRIPEKWDGKAADRIAAILAKHAELVKNEPGENADDRYRNV